MSAITREEQALLKLKQARHWIDFLTTAVTQHCNIVIAGKTGSGKTTLARSLIELIPHHERLITIEDVHELVLPNHPDKVHLLFGDNKGRMSAEACLSACMRLSPDRILLAELRGSEAWDYVTSLNTGHPGSITTTHANSARHTLDRIATLIKQSPIGQTLELPTILRVLHQTIDVVIYLNDYQVHEIYYDPLAVKSLTTQPTQGT